MNITQQLWAVKEWTRVKATGNEYVELVHSATNEEKWGPTGQQMEEICISFRSGSQEIMDELRWRLKNRDKSWRSCYKSLLVLDYLARNVSDNYLPEICSLVPTLRTIAQSFYYTNPKGVDHGVSVRERAKNLADLLSDGLLLREERAKALQTKEKLSHNASDGGGPDRFTGLGGGMNRQGNFYPASYQYERNSMNSPSSNFNRLNGGGYDPYRPTGSLASRTSSTNTNTNVGSTRLSANHPNIPRTREEQERYDLEVALRLQREEERRAGVNSTVVEEMYAREAQRRRAAEMREKEEVSFAQTQKSKPGNGNQGDTQHGRNDNNEEEEEDDEALARRLQAEEEERARREGVSLPTLRSDAEEPNTQTHLPSSSSYSASSVNTKATNTKNEKSEKGKVDKSNTMSHDTASSANEKTDHTEKDAAKKTGTAAASNVLDDLFAPAPPQPPQPPSSLGNQFTMPGAKAIDPFDTFLDNRVKQQQQQVQGQGFNLAQGPNAWTSPSMAPSSSLQPPSAMTMMMGMNANNFNYAATTNTSTSTNTTRNDMSNQAFQPMPAAQQPFPWTNTTPSNPPNFTPAVNQWGMPMQTAQASAPNTSNSYDDNMNNNNNSSSSNANMMANMAVANDIFGGQTSSTPFANSNSYNSNNTINHNNNTNNNNHNNMNDFTANTAMKGDNSWMSSLQQAPAQQQPPFTSLANTNDKSNATANMWASLDQFAQRKHN